MEVEKPTVKISDIASIVSNNNSFASYIGSITVIKNLPAGKKAVITSTHIKKVLSQNYIDLSQIQIKGNKTVVKRKIIQFDNQILEKVVKEYLQRDPNIQVVKVSTGRFKRLIFSKPYQIKIQEVSKSSNYIRLKVFLLQNGQILKQFNVSVRYKQLADVVVAVRPILRGQIISENDISLKKMDMKRGYITDPSLVVNAVAKTTIQAGKPITLNMIQPDYPVKKGSNVKVIYNRNGIRIEIVGVALENGQQGQTIKVKNPSTGKVLPCKVIGKDTVLFVGGM
ncbi:MAG: flagellar basal body P-ring formation protein FlgA [Aquificae bacterium]|nr:flagellar basal body P-ring formation protein FlgA [Aquificota bacterium]